jgi:hypothetical protein
MDFVSFWTSEEESSNQTYEHYLVSRGRVTRRFKANVRQGN